METVCDRDGHVAEFCRIHTDFECPPESIRRTGGLYPHWDILYLTALRTRIPLSHSHTANHWGDTGRIFFLGERSDCDGERSRSWHHCSGNLRTHCYAHSAIGLGHAAENACGTRRSIASGRIHYRTEYGISMGTVCGTGSRFCLGRRSQSTGAFGCCLPRIVRSGSRYSTDAHWIRRTICDEIRETLEPIQWSYKGSLRSALNPLGTRSAIQRLPESTNVVSR